MEESWNDACWRVLCALIEGGKKVGEPVTPIIVLLGPKGSGKSFLAKELPIDSEIVPFNWYFFNVAKGMIPNVASNMANLTAKEKPLFPAMQALGTYRDLLINIGDAMESMKGFVQLMYYMRIRDAVHRGAVVINDSVRRDWEVYFFRILAQAGWPVHFVEIAGRGKYSEEHKTETNYAKYLDSHGWKVHTFDNAPSTFADGAKFKKFLQKLEPSIK